MSYLVLSLMLLGLAGSACDGTDTGVGPVGPQGDIGPGDISVDGGAVVGSGRVVTDERSPSGFETVVMAGEGTLIIGPGDFGLTVGVDDNLLEFIESDVIGSVLRIQTREGIDIDPTAAPTYRVTLPVLTGVELSGAGSIRTGAWEASTFTAALTGVGDIEIEDLTSTSLALSANGVGTITAVGRTELQTVDIGGLAKYVGGDMASGSADVVCRDGGEAILWVSNSLEVEILDAGSVSYYGNPEVTQEISEAGSLIALGNR